MQGNRGTIGQKHSNEHVPKSVETSQEGKVTILWNQLVQTDRTIPNNKPDNISVNLQICEHTTILPDYRSTVHYVYLQQTSKPCIAMTVDRQPGT